MGWQDAPPVDQNQGKQPAWMSAPAVDKASQIPNDVAPPLKEEGRMPSFLAGPELALSVASSIPAAIIGNVAGVGKSLFGGKYGTSEGVKEGQDTASKVTNALTYEPRGTQAREALGTIGEALSASKLAGVGPTEAMLLSGSAPAIKAGVSTASSKVAGIAEKFKSEEPAMVGMGAATTDTGALRRARAQNLPVPLKLSKGEATRDFEQQRFEKETAKNSQAGEPLRQHAADNVQKVIQNFESWIDQTGAEAPDLISVGKAVDRPLVRKMESAKAEIRNAYSKAEKAGDMAEPVPIAPLLKFVQENSSAAKLAPVITAIESELKRLGGTDGIPASLPINDVEKLRKLVVRLGKTDETNGHYAGEANKLIDTMTEGKGGDLYKQARGMFKTYAAEFKNQGAVRDLVATKKGTSDRKIALEDVFNHSVLKGSNQDTANIIKSLEGAGPEGLQAIKELKGQTINWMLGETTKNATRDIRGNPIPSFAKIDKAVRSLDMDGKLDLLFGKQQAAQIRDLKELIADIHTAPPGAVNTSTTAAVLMEAMGALATGRLPTATAKAVSAIKQSVGDRATLKRVRDALKDPDEDLNIGAGNNTVH